ncbi:hypothetical protein BH20ACI1_BH20ACI1_09890 [soil metagenome]
MLKKSLFELYERELNQLISEIRLYEDENSLWLTNEKISNSGGNLCLHLVGNLNHFIGATLGDSGYVRNRDAEFSSKNIVRADLIGEIENTINVVKAALNKLSDEDLSKDFPIEMFGKTFKTDFMLLHLLTHLNYHLGQINYHRRLFQNS